MRINILHYHRREPGLGGGGAETMIRSWYSGLSERHDVVWYDGSEPISQVRVPDVSIVGTMHVVDPHLEWTVRALHDMPYVLSPFDYWPFCPHRMCLIGDRRCSASNGRCGNECGVFPSVACEHPWSDTLYTFAARSVVFVANRKTRDIFERHGIRVARVIPFGVDVEMFRPCDRRREEWNTVWASSAWAGYKTKGMHVLAEACSGRQWGVKLITNVPRAAVAEMLSRAHIYVFPSCYDETWGLCLTEAMACGCACVATDVAGALDQIEHMESGIIVPAGDGVSLRDAVEMLLSDRELVDSLGANARKRAVEMFNEQRMIADIERLLEDVCAEREPQTGGVGME